MTKLTSKKASRSTKSTNAALNPEREFSKIKEGIKHNQAKIAEFLTQRVGPGDWQLTETNVPLEDDGGTIDMVFSSSDGKKEKYVLVAVSVPHLSIGQKYLLPTQAKIFQKMRDVAATRIKKAIILVRKGTETISLQALKVRCPIIEIQLENIVKQSRTKSAKAEKVVSETIEETSSTEKEEPKESRQAKSTKERSKDKKQKHDDEPQKPQNGFSAMSEELLLALKEAIVHENLSTSYKRVNKYIRRGLWHWIEREIMDPNVHFFLIILSSIYQSKTGEILSKKFRTFDTYIEDPDSVIKAIFSRENTLADEIKKNSERHKKALTKFICCFSAQPPYEYLKSLFLKEFRSNGDGLKARMSVYTTLEQLLARCGFEGEKEINYPLEILDELKIFQGILCGNYEHLRTDNASKKLKHLVPQIDWAPEDIYALRDQLAKLLNLPSLEFNLNAYLPQAFMQDAKDMNESRREAMKGASNNESNRQNNEDKQEKVAPAKLSRQERMALQKQAKLERQAAKRKYDDEYMPKKHQQHETADMPMFGENGEIITEEAKKERQNRELLIPQEMDGEEVKRILDDPYAFTQPTSKKPRKKIEIEPEPVESLEEQAEEVAAPVKPVEEKAKPTREVRMKRSRYADVDESRHRHFENYGGIDEEDPDVIRLSLAMAKHGEDGDIDGESSDIDGDDSGYYNRAKGKEEPEVLEDLEPYEEIPTKTMIAQGYRPRKQNVNKPSYRNNNGYGKRSNSRNDDRRNNDMGGNRGYRNNGFRENRKYKNHNGNGNFNRRPRRDGGNN